ncbi:MAG: NAD(P)/FAD-dependent oxidoreductase [Calditerrivibrio sp.]|nr:NAD(P)/FAD-dependent oxidoreductase [Calditerrivibrio sp.]
MKSFDVAVIGAGPAGTSAAYDLADAGLSVLILEKKAMPREKPCGGAISYSGQKFLRFDIPEDLVDAECFGARINTPESSITSITNDRLAILVSRKNFDSYLLDMALNKGVAAVYEMAKEIKEDSGFYHIYTNANRYLAKNVIIATGIQSTLIKNVRRLDNKDELGICLEAEIDINENSRYKDLKNIIEIHFGVAGYGYGWVFPHGNFLSIGVGGVTSVFKEPNKAMYEFMSKLGFKYDRKKIRGHMIPKGGIKRLTRKGGLFLVGDAAGFVEPFTGEGIAYAIRSGQIAANTIIKAFKNSDFSEELLSNYEKICSAEIGSTMGYALFFSKMLHKFPNLLLNKIMSNQHCVDKYLEIISQKITYKDYIKWIFKKLPKILIG